MIPKTDNPDSPEPDSTQLLPGSYSPWLVKAFRVYVERLIAKKFYAVRIHGDTANVLAACEATNHPVMVILSHTSWWDPLMSVLLAGRLVPSRSACAPMDITQLRKFGFFRKLGLFGIHPDSHQSLRLMSSYVGERFAKDTFPTLWITPQGRFQDVRSPLRTQPGAAVIAAAHSPITIISIAIEYAFWLDQRPEVFIRIEPVVNDDAEHANVRSWQHAMTHAMMRNAATLAQGVMSRDPSRFTPLVGGNVTKVNPVFDLWRRIRGGDNTITDSHRKKGPL